MKKDLSAVPFVFQVAGALREFMMTHAGEKVVDFSIGTPPTSEQIRQRQSELIFGTSENPFAQESFENDLFKSAAKIILNMGKYESAGGKMELKEKFEKELKENESITVISGGQAKAKRLLQEIGESSNNSIRIISEPLLEKCALSAIIGPSETIKTLEALHTCVSGTPSSPQEDLYLLLTYPAFQKNLEDVALFEKDPHTLTDFLLFCSLIYRETSANLLKEGKKLRKLFAHQFMKCFFAELKPAIKEECWQMQAGSGGGRQALHYIEKVLVEKGVKEMLIFGPHWTYENVYRKLLLGFIPLKNNGQPDFEILEKELKTKTPGQCALTLNSPHNPTGTILEPKSLQKILALCQKYDIFIVDDACYLDIIHSSIKECSSLLKVAEKMVAQEILNENFLQKIFIAVTASKGLGMAGARIGGIIFAEQNLSATFEKLYDEDSPPLMALFLACRLIEDPKTHHELLLLINEEISRRVQQVTTTFRKEKLEYIPPSGAFYLQVQTPFLKNKISDMKDFTLHLAREKGIAAIPMEIYGGEKFALRLSLGGEKNLQQLSEEAEILVAQLNTL